jgi:rSAM/selenodomain-associated transferase 2
MPAPLTVVIPTLDAAEVLPATAEALLEGVTSGLVAALVLSDGGSADATREIAKELGALWVEGPPGRGGQIALGVEAAGSDWVLILHADTQLSPGWHAAARRHMTGYPDKAGWFLLRFRAPGLAPRLVETGANLRARLLGLPWGDQGLLVRKAVLAEVGGVPDLPLMEDVALARRLRRRLRPLEARALTSADRYQRNGWVAQVARNLLRLARYASGADPARLAARYGRRGS